MRQQSRQPNGRPEGRIKGYSRETATQKRELDNSSKPNWIKGKRKPAREKTPQIRKSYSFFLRVMLADGRCWSQWRWWWVRTSQANHKSMWQSYGVLGVQHRKASLNRQPSAHIAGGGARASPNTSYVIQKWTVNATLVMGHQANPAHC
jgi:hypothetical protein